MTDEILNTFFMMAPITSAWASLPGMRDRTITINSLQDIQSHGLAGRAGTALLLRRPHPSEGSTHFLTGGAPHPLQVATAAALQMDRSLLSNLAEDYRERRDFLGHVREEPDRHPCSRRLLHHDRCKLWGIRDGISFSHHLVETIGVATVPGVSFYSQPSLGATKVRFCFPKRMETLEQAAGRLRKFKK